MMITFEEALGIVLDHRITLESETVPLAEAPGRLLREPLVADRDFPPFDRVTMDGIALGYQAWAEGQRHFRIAGVGPAGAPQARLENPAACLEIMTGAVLPAGADTVIRYEDLAISDGVASIITDMVRRGQNVHRQGEDRRQGQIIVPAGKRITAAEVGVAATVGKTHLQVSCRPKVLIASSGDELVDIPDRPLQHQIRRSNVYAMHATLNQWGLTADLAHLPDDEAAIRSRLEDYLHRYQVLIMSGGVSKGKYDYLPDTLAALGVQKCFHKVMQRPGKPFWFGQHPAGAVVFAFPGNPVSAFVGMYLYFRPWLDACLDLPEEPPVFAILEKDIRFRPDLTYFAQVRLRHTPDGRLFALPAEGHGSGDFANLVDADAIMIIPRGKENFPAGEAYPVVRFR